MIEAMAHDLPPSQLRRIVTLTIGWVTGAGQVPSSDLPRFIALYRAGLLPVDCLLTHRLHLEDLSEGFDRLAQGDAIRQVVVFD